MRFTQLTIGIIWRPKPTCILHRYSTNQPTPACILHRYSTKFCRDREITIYY